ncbi:MAG: PLP-dependent aspartate aminotransferase family protein [candidate division WOR-3 bacterium]
MKKVKKSLETRCAQALGWIEKETSSLVPSIYPSTTFIRNSDLSYNDGRAYTRADNPTYDQASALIAELEGGKSAQLFSSGMAAVVAVFQTLKAGDHLVLPQNVYCGTRTWVEKYASSWGIEYDIIENNDYKILEKIVKKNNTKLVWIETPSNPELRITDIGRVVDIAKSVDALVVADNTLATPVLTKPIEYGVDITLHSATKYLNGHGDALIGALVSKDENNTWQKIKEIAHDGGALPGPVETWLLLRGMRTLYIRMNKICKNAEIVANFLNQHPQISKVFFPGLPTSDGYEVATKQMNGLYGGILSIRVKGGYKKAVEVQAKVNIFKRATSFGTIESLIEHRASYEGPRSNIPDDLLRLSIGIENSKDLISDLKQALE